MELSERRPPGPTLGRLAGWSALVGTLIALNWVSRLAAEEAVRSQGDAFYRWDTFVAATMQFTLMLLIVVWIAAYGPARTLLGLGRPGSWRTAATGAGIVFLSMIVISATLNPVLEPGEEQGLVPDEFDESKAAPLAANALLTATYVPVVEELTFRGLGVSLLNRFGRSAALLGTALAFGLAHGLVLALPILVAFGLGLAWLRMRTGSVYPCIALHGLFNAVSVAVGVFVDPANGT